MIKIIISPKGKKYIIQEEREEDFHTDFGILKKEDLNNAKIGETITTHLEKPFQVLKATVNDFIELMDRRCSILLPKDVGTITSYTGLGSGDKVIDAGTGAAASALSFANIVGDTGHVTSYEIREDFHIVAQKNVDTIGYNNITLKNQDIKEGITEKDVDLVFLDLPKPYECFEHVYEALKMGGYLVVYAPYIEQLQISHRIGKKVGFKEITPVEVLQREIEVRDRGTRPKTRMLGHSGYIVFARKL